EPGAGAGGVRRGGAPGARGEARGPGGHRYPHQPGVRGHLLRRAAGRRGAGAALPAGPAGAAGRIPPRHRADAGAGRRRAGGDRRAGEAAAGAGGGGGAASPGAGRSGGAPRRRAGGVGGGPAGGPGADPVLLRVDGGSQAGGAGAAAPRLAVRRAEGADAGAGELGSARRLVAAAVPRHGAHRRPALRRVLPWAAGAHPARGVPRLAGDLAARHLALPRHRLARAQLRVRAVPEAGERPGPGGRGPAELAVRAQRRGAGVAGGAAAVRAALRAAGVRPGVADAGVRVVGGGAGGDLLAEALARPDVRGGRARAGGAEAGAYELASVGRPVPGVEVEVRGEDGRARPERQVGRVMVRGPSVMRGYFEDEVGSRGALSGGWLNTGDLGFIEDGELFLCGREKDLVIIRGANHAPQEFEGCLEGLAGVRPGCAVALGFTPPGGTSEELLMLAERRGDTSEDARVAEDIRTAVVEATGVRPHTVKLLEPGTLPRTSSGKMRRGEALRRYLAGQLSPPKKMNVVRLAAELARSTFA